jgi:hypothetical protein
MHGRCERRNRAMHLRRDRCLGVVCHCGPRPGWSDCHPEAPRVRSSRRHDGLLPVLGLASARSSPYGTKKANIFPVVADPKKSRELLFVNGLPPPERGMCASAPLTNRSRSYPAEQRGGHRCGAAAPCCWQAVAQRRGAGDSAAAPVCCACLTALHAGGTR